MKSKLAPLLHPQKHLKSLGFFLQKYWLELALIGAGGLGLWLGSQQLPLLTQSQQLQTGISGLQSSLSQATLQDKERFSLEKDLLALQKDKITLENTIRTNQLQGIGGALLVITAYVSWRNYQATQQKQVAERFSKAVEQLGSDNIHVRLGGIYALEQIAKDAEEKYYWQVIETLTAYVREKSPYQPEAKEKPKTLVESVLHSQTPPIFKESPRLATDIQAVMTVLARRKHSYTNGEEHHLDLRNTNLRELQLPPRAKLQGIDFSRSNLQGVYLDSANLQGAKLREANLPEAGLDLANLQGAELREANLQGAYLISADLQGAYLREANLQWAELKLANLQRAYLDSANLQGAHLNSANLRGAHLNSANLRGACLYSANLQGACLYSANLQGAQLYSADLQGAYLDSANLQGAKLRKIRSMILSADVVGLSWEQLQKAASYVGAELPDYLLQNPPGKTEWLPTEVSIQPKQATDNSQEGSE